MYLTVDLLLIKESNHLLQSEIMFMTTEKLSLWLTVDRMGVTPLGEHQNIVTLQVAGLCY